MKLLIIIPSFNEEKMVRKVINKCLKYSKYVLAINDGSEDNTLKEINKTKAICLNNIINKGKGYCLKKGFTYSYENKFDIVITIDADGQHDPDYIPIFLKEIQKGYGIIMGVRQRKGSDMPYTKRASNFILSLIFSILSKRWFKDSQSGYRAIKVSILKDLKLESNRYGTESEILIKLGKKKTKFGEIDIPTIYKDKKNFTNFIQNIKRFFSILKVTKYWMKKIETFKYLLYLY